MFYLGLIPDVQSFRPISIGQSGRGAWSDVAHCLRVQSTWLIVRVPNFLIVLTVAAATSPEARIIITEFVLDPLLRNHFEPSVRLYTGECIASFI